MNLCRMLIVVVAMSFMGCGTPNGNTSDASTAVPATVASHFFSNTDSPANCRNQCHLNSIHFALAALGIDPSLHSEIQFDRDVTSILRQLKFLGAQMGTEILEDSVASVLDELPQLPVCSAALIHQSGHIYFIVGLSNVGDEELIQVIHGDSFGALIPKQEILNGSFNGAWRFIKKHQGVVLHVGSGQLKVDSFVKSLGLVHSGIPAITKYRFQNVGDIPAYLNNAQSSCSCTVVDLRGPICIEPGDEYELDVSMTPNESASQRQYVIVNASDSIEGATVPLKLTLFAFQSEKLPVTPSAVDFESVAVGSTSQRTVRLREVESVRFNIQGINVGDLPLNYSIRADLDSRGLAIYTVTFELKPTAEFLGKRTGLCLISTSNRVHPEARIVVSYEAVPALEIIPSTLTLGEVTINQACTNVLLFRTASREPITISDVKLPRECNYEIIDGNGETRLVVTTILATPGLWQDSIALRANTKLASHNIMIRCSGLATKK